MQVNSELQDEVRSVMADTFGLNVDEVPEDIEQETAEYWNSLYHLTLIVALEERFSTAFTVDEIPEMTSLAKIVSVLQTRD